eukprot:8325263-Lingulodinium_polyedra.AAC.1
MTARNCSPQGPAARAPGAVDITEEIELLREPTLPAGASAAAVRRYRGRVEETFRANHCLVALRGLGQAGTAPEVLRPRTR